MRRKSISVIIVIFNILLVVLAFYYLYEDYLRVGKFQWVDPNAIEDNEELYFTPIFFCIFILGLISSIFDVLKLSGIRIHGTLNILLKSISYIHGTFLLLVSIIFISMTLGNIGNHDYEKGFVLFTTMLMLTLLSIGLFGGLIIYNNTTRKKTPNCT